MKWKIALGVGLACAACCAAPILALVGGLGFLGAASGDGLAMIAGGGLLGAIIVVYFVQRRDRQNAGACDIDGSCGCKQEGSVQ